MFHDDDPMGRLLRRKAEALRDCDDGYLRPIPDQREQIERFQYDASGRLVSAQNMDARLQWFYQRDDERTRHYARIHADFVDRLVEQGRKALVRTP